MRRLLRTILCCCAAINLVPSGAGAFLANRVPSAFLTGTARLDAGEVLNLTCAFADADSPPYTAMLVLNVTTASGESGSNIGLWYGSDSTFVAAHIGAPGVDETVANATNGLPTNFVGGVFGMGFSANENGLGVRIGVAMWGDEAPCAVTVEDIALPLQRGSRERAIYAVATDFTPDADAGAAVAMSSTLGSLSPGSASVNTTFRRRSDGFLVALFNGGLVGEISLAGPGTVREAGPAFPLLVVSEATSGAWAYHVDHQAFGGGDGTLLWLMEFPQ